MKKDRNSFFNESSYSYGNFMPNNNMMPVNQASYNQSFYSGPGYPQMPNNTTIDYSDVESRLSKIERTLNRIDSRLTKLETTSNITTETIENNTNMYMV